MRDNAPRRSHGLWLAFLVCAPLLLMVLTRRLGLPSAAAVPLLSLIIASVTYATVGNRRMLVALLAGIAAGVAATVDVLSR